MPASIVKTQDAEAVEREAINLRQRGSGGSRMAALQDSAVDTPTTQASILAYVRAWRDCSGASYLDYMPLVLMA
jgi:hypothetical protein